MANDLRPSVLVGMSGGVDSSVAAARLCEAGYRVIGGFIKNWSDSKDAWTGECAWRSERRDALRVASRLGIPLLTFDFEDAYRGSVVADLVRGYEQGETPNPDVLCNEIIKFGLFMGEADRLGITHVATGHYARTRTDPDGTTHLLRGRDPDKDQSYFLYRLSQEKLQRVLFPIGDMTKIELREEARERGIPVADKPDSQGICFIGKLDLAAFLRTQIPAETGGDIVDPEGTVLGQHEGLSGYTVGQRHRLFISQGGEAWYVAKKDRLPNRLVVVPGEDHPLLFTREARIGDVHWTTKPPTYPVSCSVQVRYRQTPIPARITLRDGETADIVFAEPVKAVAPGQSAVFYDGEECLGGGVLLSPKHVS